MRSALVPLIMVGLLAGVLCCGPAVAQTGSPTALTPKSPLYYLGQAVLSLVVVVALIYAIYFGLRRLSTAGLPSREGRQLKLLESQHLGGGRWVYMIEVAGRVLIVGGGSDGLRTLAEMSADEYQSHLDDTVVEGTSGGDASDD